MWLESFREFLRRLNPLLDIASERRMNRFRKVGRDIRNVLRNVDWLGYSKTAKFLQRRLITLAAVRREAVSSL